MSQRARFDDVQIGEIIPAFTAPAVSRLQLALFAGAAADHNPIHVDEAAARAGGLPGVIAHGMLSMAVLGRLLTRWVPQQSIRSFSARFVAMAFPGDVITCTGTVAAKSSEGGENRVQLELAAQNQKGEKILVGKATVALP
jgi:acyl dehydratase